MKNASTEAIKRSMDVMVEPTETDESGSLHFQAPSAAKKEGGIPERERKVKFHSRVRCRRTKTGRADSEPRWYTKEEIAAFRKRDKYIQQSLITSRSTCLTGDDDGEEVSLVGLNSERERKQRLKRVREARACVMGEQLSQEENFFEADSNLEGFKLDQDIIAEFYSSYSKRSSKISHMRGLQLSWHVERLWEEDDEQDKENDDASQRSCSQRSCSQHSISISSSRPARNSSLRSAGGSLIARLSSAAV